MRPSLSLKDDDYRLSFLYGNFTTLTRFTEADLERVVTERLSPLNVSIHATDPDVRARMLRNRRGATSLRWLRALLDHGIEVHGQVVVCRGVNDGDVLADTLTASSTTTRSWRRLAVVPLGISRYSTEPSMRAHTQGGGGGRRRPRAAWQERFLRLLGRGWCSPRRVPTCSPAPLPAAESYEGFAMHEDGIGMAARSRPEFHGSSRRCDGPPRGFFSWVDGAPAEGYRGRARAPARCGSGPAAPPRSGSSPVPTAPRSWVRWWPRWADPTSASCPWPTSSSAATSASPA
jgi:NifB/MoaA-like Fe-S oxidoreductase